MVPPPPAVGAVALHGGSKWLKLAKNKFTWSDFTNFSKQVQQIPFPVVASPHIENLSNCCRHKYDQSISRIFKNLIFGMFLTFSPNTSDQAVLFSAAKSPRSSLQPLWLTDMGRRRPYKLHWQGFSAVSWRPDWNRWRKVCRYAVQPGCCRLMFSFQVTI